MDVQKGMGPEMLERYRRNFPPSKKTAPFFSLLVEGVLAALEKIDAVIEAYSSNWKLGRISAVDRNVLRIAVYEMLYLSDIPSKVSINEAIDIAKKYGSEESGAFINGILDSIHLAQKNSDDRLFAIIGNKAEASRSG